MKSTKPIPTLRLVAFEGEIIAEARRLAEHHARIGMPPNAWQPPWLEYWPYAWHYQLVLYKTRSEQRYAPQGS